MVVRQAKPTAPEIKINIDGSSNQARMLSGVSCVMRGHKGKWLGGEGHNVGYVSSLAAKLLAILYGMQLAQGSGHRLVVLESDSIEAVDMVMGRCVGIREDHPIIQECKDILPRDWLIDIRYVFREFNRIADWIAKRQLKRKLESLIRVVCLKIYWSYSKKKLK